MLRHSSDHPGVATSKPVLRVGLPGVLALVVASLVIVLLPLQTLAAENRAPSMTDSFAAAREIANEVRQIDKRLTSVEASVAGIDASLKPVGSLAQPEAIKRLTHDTVDHAMNRLTWLLLLATACLAGLMLLAAYCWRFALRHASTP